MNNFAITVDKKRYADAKKKFEIRLSRSEKFLWSISERKGTITHITMFSAGLPQLVGTFNSSRETDSDLIVKFDIVDSRIVV